MSFDRNLLEAECQLGLIKHIDANESSVAPIDLWIDGFWAAVIACEKLLAIDDLKAELVKVNEQIALARKRPRRVPNYGGEPNAQHRRPESATDAPTRRANDAAAKRLAADLEAEARRARDRDRAGRQAAHEHSDKVKR